MIPIGISTIAVTAQDMQYTSGLGLSIDEVLSGSYGNGNKYVVYDDESQRFRAGILPQEYRADAAEKIGGVLRLTTDYVSVGQYTGAGTPESTSSTST